jgi:hypothetical protein
MAAYGTPAKAPRGKYTVAVCVALCASVVMPTHSKALVPASLIESDSHSQSIHTSVWNGTFPSYSVGLRRFLCRNG